MHYAQKSLSFI